MVFLCKDCRHHGTKRCPRSLRDYFERVKFEAQYTNVNFVTMQLCPGLEDIVLGVLPDDERKEVMSHARIARKMNFI